MGWVSSRSLVFFVAGILPTSFFIGVLPSRSASALAAWSLGTNGVLELRTSVGAQLRAFFQSADAGKGGRVWIDFPGELSRPRRISGNGPIREIRLGKPSKGVTRLVVELIPSISLDPSKLSLVGISPDRWKLSLIGMPTKGLSRIGEGDLLALSSRRSSRSGNIGFNEKKFSSSSLPRIPRGIYRVVIDPGHGGPDPGAVGIGGIRETDVVLDISLQVAKLLQSRGVKVHLTRTNEVDLDLPPRVAIANRLGATAFVSIHANASRNNRKDANGVETFYFAGSRGLRLSQNIHRELVAVSPGSPDRGVRRGRFFVIRRTNMPAALVETGFLTGRFDSKRLSSSSHRKTLAFAIAKGIINYLREK